MSRLTCTQTKLDAIECYVAPYSENQIFGAFDAHHNIQEKDVVQILMEVLMSSNNSHAIQILQQAYDLSYYQIVGLFFRLITCERTYHSEEYVPKPYSPSINYTDQVNDIHPIQYCTHYMYTIPGSDYLFYFVYYEGNRDFTICSEKHAIGVYEAEQELTFYDELAEIPKFEGKAPHSEEACIYKHVKHLYESDFSEEALVSMYRSYPREKDAFKALLKANSEREPFFVCLHRLHTRISEIVMEDADQEFVDKDIGFVSPKYKKAD